MKEFRNEKGCDFCVSYGGGVVLYPLFCSADMQMMMTLYGYSIQGLGSDNYVVSF